jgi:hypothetical protein
VACYLVGENCVESIGIHQGIETCIAHCHTFEKVFELLKMPKAVDLVQLLQDKVLIFPDVHCEQSFENEVQRQN